MLRNILYLTATIFLLASCYFTYHWLISDPLNKEPLPAILSICSSIVLLIIGWQTIDANKNDKIDITRTTGKSIIEIEPRDNTNYKISDTKSGSKISIGKKSESTDASSSQNNSSNS